MLIQQAREEWIVSLSYRLRFSNFACKITIFFWHMQMLGKQMHYSDYRLLKLRIIYLLYNIGVLNTQRFGAFVLEIGDFSG